MDPPVKLAPLAKIPPRRYDALPGQSTPPCGSAPDEGTGHAETRERSGSRGAGTSTAASSHCITRGNRNAITAPSSKSPALTSNVTCKPCTKESRAARRRAIPTPPPNCPATSYASPSECPADVEADAGTPGTEASPGAYAAFITLPSSAIPIPAPSWYDVSPIAAAPPACSGGDSL